MQVYPVLLQWMADGVFEEERLSRIRFYFYARLRKCCKMPPHMFMYYNCLSSMQLHLPWTIACHLDLPRISFWQPVYTRQHLWWGLPRSGHLMLGIRWRGSGYVRLNQKLYSYSHKPLNHGVLTFEEPIELEFPHAIARLSTPICELFMSVSADVYDVQVKWCHIRNRELYARDYAEHRHRLKRVLESMPRRV